MPSDSPSAEDSSLLENGRESNPSPNSPEPSASADVSVSSTSSSDVSTNADVSNLEKEKSPTPLSIHEFIDRLPRKSVLELEQSSSATAHKDSKGRPKSREDLQKEWEENQLTQVPKKENIINQFQSSSPNKVTLSGMEQKLEKDDGRVQEISAACILSTVAQLNTSAIDTTTSTATVPSVDDNKPEPEATLPSSETTSSSTREKSKRKRAAPRTFLADQEQQDRSALERYLTSKEKKEKSRKPSLSPSEKKKKLTTAAADAPSPSTELKLSGTSSKIAIKKRKLRSPVVNLGPRLLRKKSNGASSTKTKRKA